MVGVEQPEQPDPRRGHRAILLALLVLAAMLFLLYSCQPRQTTELDGSGETVLGDATFRIDGDTVRSMSPGVMRRVDLTMTNPHGETLTVRGLAIAVAAVSAPRSSARHPCSVADFAVEQPRADLEATVPADTTTSLSDLGLQPAWWPRVGMLDRPVNQDGCKGAAVTLLYSGSGTFRS